MARSIVLGVLATVLPALTAQAAPATREGADALVAVFERYIGHPAPGEQGGVTVAPEGASYRATFDVKRMVRALEAFGMSVEPASSVMVLTPQDNGTWKVASDGFPPLVMHLKEQTLTMRSGSYAFDGTFDPKVHGFTDGTTRQTASTMTQDSPALTQDRRIDAVTATQKGKAAEGGTSSFDIHYAATGIADTMVFRAPPAKTEPGVVAPPAPATAPVSVGYSTPGTVLDASFDQLHAKDILDLWAFFVAHPSKEGVKASQDELRGLLRTALPFTASFQESGSVDQLAVTSPVGPFSVHKVASSISFKNLAAVAEAAMTVSFDGLKVPNESLPPWSLGLVPTSVDLQPSFSGLHLAEAARETVEDFDLNVPDGFTPDQKAKIGALLMPTMGKVTLAQSRITSELLDLKMSGDATLNGADATGRLSVTGTGLDKAIATLQAAAGSDEVAAQVLSGFVAAKNLAKPNPDGSFTWDMELGPGGSLTVNGVAMK